jgi:hypothetical protein
MNVTITDIPFKTDKKTLSLTEFLSKYISFVQDKENLKQIEDDLKNDDKKSYSLDEIRKMYAQDSV